MRDTKHTLSYDPNSIYPRGAYGENKCIKMDGEIVAEVFCQSSTSTADHDARVLASELVHRYNTHPSLIELVEHALKEQMSMAPQYRDKWFIENAEEALATASA